MSYRSVEIYYDIASIPGIDAASNRMGAALDFRNAAMERIETALAEAGLGEWAGAESDGNEVNFGFEVSDFDAAEQLIRQTVADTIYQGIREITRYEEG